MSRYLRWNTVFYVILALYVTVIVTTFTDYGITPDEIGHVNYGQSVVAWYATFFQERSVFTWTNTWLYGGIYDAVSYLATKVSPLAFYDTRHLCNAFVGLLGVVAAYRIGLLLGPAWMGCLSAVFLILTPCYYGHAFNNHKDIPFAVGYLWSLFWLMRGIERFPNLPRFWVVTTGLAMGLTMGIRVGGIALLFFMVLFYGLRLVFLARTCQVERQTVIQGLSSVAVMGMIAYGAMLIGWPWAQLNPLVRPFQALTFFSQFPVPFINFFDGAYIKSTENPWFYAIKWLLITMPEFVFVGLLSGCVVLWMNRKTIGLTVKTFQMALLVFGVVFPLVYAMSARVALYDGMRHVLFAIPPLVVLGALGVGGLMRHVAHKWQWGLMGLICGLMFWTLWQMVRLHPNQYVFFNRIFAGGLSSASLKYDVDYHDNSYKLGVRWVEENISSNHPIQLASASSSTHYLLNRKRFVYRENPFQADVYLVSTRLEQHRAVPGDVLKIFEADGVPVLYVIRPDTAFARRSLFQKSGNPYFGMILGDLYNRIKQPDAALLAYRSVLDYDPHMASAHAAVARLFLDRGYIEEAVVSFHRAIDAKAQDATVFTDLGDCYARQKRYEVAIDAYQKALIIRPYYLRALRNLARTQLVIGQPDLAVQTAQRTLEINPSSIHYLQFWGSLLFEAGHHEEAETTFLRLKTLAPDMPETYENLAILYRKKNQIENAEQFLREGINRIPGHAPFYVLWAEILSEQGKRSQAIERYLQALHYQPDNALVLRDLGGLLAETGQLNESVQTLQKAIVLDDKLWDAWYLLGQIYEYQKATQRAVTAYQNALAIKPDHGGAKERLARLSRP